MATTTKQTPEPNKKPATSLEKFEAKIENVGKPSPRLPRMGCLWIFGIFLLFAVGFATAYFHSVGEIATNFEIPEGRVTISDSEGVLLEQDQAALEALANDISKLANCEVAAIFFDARFASLLTVFDEIAADWAPGKGVLLICDVRNSTMRFGLIGEGWRLADWDINAVMKEAAAYRLTQRGAQAVALFTRLKHSIEAAANAPEQKDNVSGAAATAEQSAPVRKNASAMTEEDIEAQIAAEEKAAEARIAAEDKVAEDALDEDFDDDDMSAGMRAYAEKNKRAPSGILYSDAVSRGDEGSSRNYALVFLALTVLVAVIALKSGKKTRETNIKNNPKVLADYKKKKPSNKALRLSDLNEYEPTSWLHKGFLKVAAIALGILFGIGFVSSTLTEPVEKDVERPVSAMIPDYPEDGRIVDSAEVFTPEGREMISKAINHLEEQTGGEMMVFTISTINGRAIEDFSLDAAMKWKIGKKGKDNGALFVLAVDDHLNRIEVGYGWEGPVNDARAGDLLRQIVPELRAEQYAEATVKVVQGIEFYVTGIKPADEPGAAPVQPQKVYTQIVKDFGPLTYAKPQHDPRQLDPADSMWGMIGILGCLLAILAAYWGRIVMTSAPHLYIYDPTIVRTYSSSGGGGSSGSSRSYSSSRSSYSSHSSHSGGGGSFGGGGASGRW